MNTHRTDNTSLGENYFFLSPIPLQLTFSKNDIFSANIYSKSVLRAAVENVISTDEGVFYFPSYELALNIGSDFF
jgi:hypothetical protein